MTPAMKTITSRARVFTVLFLSLAVAGSTVAAPAARSAPGRAQFRIDAKKSRFIVETETSGLSSMFAHDHKIEIGGFSGTAAFVPGNLSTGTLEMTVQADSLKLLEENTLGARQGAVPRARGDAPPQQGPVGAPGLDEGVVRAVRARHLHG